MYDPRAVVSYGFPFDDFNFTYKISGAPVQADLGKALAIDTGAASTFKLAGDGDTIRGRLFSLEDRTQQGAGIVGTVQRKFKEKLPCAPGHTIALGDSVVGAGAGLVKDAGVGVSNNTLVVEVGTDFVVVEYL